MGLDKSRKFAEATAFTVDIAMHQPGLEPGSPVFKTGPFTD
jgi:hypothetical protein